MTILTPQERLERIKRILDLAEDLRESYGVDTAETNYHEKRRYAGTPEYYYSEIGDIASAVRITISLKKPYHALKILAPLFKDLGDLDNSLEDKNLGTDKP